MLRAIKDLEFDRGMKKVSDADYADMLARLRARALMLMDQLERIPDLGAGALAEAAVKPAAAADKDRRRAVNACGRCGTRNEPDAKFCKQCGDRLGSVNA